MKTLGSDGAVALNNRADWEILPSPVLRSSLRRAATIPATPPDLPPEILASDKVHVASVFAASPKPAARRGGSMPHLDLSVSLASGERSIIALRREYVDPRTGKKSQGAITFHRADEHVLATKRRGARTTPAPTVAHFRIPVRHSDIGMETTASRRGVFSTLAKKVVKVIVLKIVDAVVDRTLPLLAAAWEKNAWKKENLAEGWQRVDRVALAAKRVTSWTPDAATLGAGRSLLFLHGTFSNAGSAFHKLTATDFFDRIQSLYGDRLFAFDHFTMSRTPEENARMLLDALPRGAWEFDVITHSRGGLVLRNLVERSAVLGSAAQRFRVGRAVLVASPNEGTPLATPERWEQTVGWLANLLEVFPENPFTTGASWVGEAIVWLARHASGNLAGIASMNRAGPLISDLQSPPGPPLAAYSALASNYAPDKALWARMLDVGIDGFFGVANDLVVPTAGGWNVDKDGTAYIPPARVGCFGVGGNLSGAQPVHHLNFFEQPATVTFIAEALVGTGHAIPALDFARLLPNRRGVDVPPRATVAPSVADHGVRSDEPLSAPAPLPQTRVLSSIPATTISTAPAQAADTFYLTILQASEMHEVTVRDRLDRPAQLLASYGGATVLVDFPRRGGDAGARFQKIIAMQERLRNYINGDDNATLPSDRDLIDFGTLLFNTIFPDPVRRLYDVARSLRGGERLDLVFTSMIPWVADKPWEFAYDPQRHAFLAREEINFVRNVITSVPAEEVSERPLPLRILVVAAQPVGAPDLSTEEEIALIQRDFAPLIDIGAVDIEVLPRATPLSFHGYISTGHFDVVHFVGHGEFLDDDSGALIFEDTGGAAQPLRGQALREIMCQRGIRLVFLNACETARDSHQDANVGAAAALAAGGVPAVVANQFKVLDQAATSFAQFFYWALAQGMSIARAAREARTALGYSIAGETIDWAVPVLYTRNPRANLAPRVHAGGSGRPEAPPITTSKRSRAIAGHTRTIGVWDVAHDFPELETTLAQLNAAQTRFGFQLVNLSAPIGTWRIKLDGKHRVYLMANKVVERLQHKPQEYGLDGLICITNQPLWGKDKGRVVSDLYAWWDEPKRPVMLISTAGFEMPTTGPVIEKAISNTIALCLAGQLSQMNAHPGGPSESLFFRNDARSPEIIAGQRKLERSCREKLKAKIPKDLSAIEALLDVFPAPALGETAPTRSPRRKTQGLPKPTRPPKKNVPAHRRRRGPAV
jgi:hypothetical protein